MGHGRIGYPSLSCQSHPMTQEATLGHVTGGSWDHLDRPWSGAVVASEDVVRTVLYSIGRYMLRTDTDGNNKRRLEMMTSVCVLGREGCIRVLMHSPRLKVRVY